MDLRSKSLDFLSSDDLKAAAVPPLRAGRLLAELKALKPFTDVATAPSSFVAVAGPSSQIDDWIIPLSHIRIHSSTRLGSGATATVSQGNHSHIQSHPSFEPYFYSEAKAWTQLHHHNIVRLYGVSLEPQKLLEMELCSE